MTPKERKQFERLQEKAANEFAEGKFIESIQTYFLSVKHDPYNFEPHIGIALSYMAIKDWANAKKEFLITLAIKPDHTSALELLAAIYLREGNLNEAIELFERDVKIHRDSGYPLDMLLVKHLCQAYQKNGRTEDARELLNEGLALYPMNEELLILRDKIDLR